MQAVTRGFSSLFWRFIVFSHPHFSQAVYFFFGLPLPKPASGKQKKPHAMVTFRHPYMRSDCHGVKRFRLPTNCAAGFRPLCLLSFPGISFAHGVMLSALS
jgi:hypothetical protein